MMKISIDPEAELEINQATEYYEAIDPSLGRRFRDELADAIQRIVENPTAYKMTWKSYRKAKIHVFPYGLLYSLKDDQLILVQCRHMSRRAKRPKRSS